MRAIPRFPVWTLVLLCLSMAAAPIVVRAQFRNGNQTILLDLPRVSQRAVVTQRIGLTDITVTYHRPQAKGRQVFGDLVAYGRVWRAGANDNTTIEFTHPITIEGSTLPAGRYGVFIMPGQAEWTVIFSKNSTSWGNFSYDPKEDALRVGVTPVASEVREALSYEFDDLTADSASLRLRWDRLAVPVRLSVDVKNITLASLRNQLRHLAGYQAVYWFEAALYCVDNGFNYPEALGWIDRAIQMDGERFDNLDVKSQILAGLNRTEEADTTLKKALSIASADQKFMYGRRLLSDNKLAEAERLFVEITTTNPESWRAWYGLAQVQAEKGDRKAAEKSLTEAFNRATMPADKGGLKRMLERLAAGLSIRG